MDTVHVISQIERQLMRVRTISNSVSNLTRVGEQNVNHHRVRARLTELRKQWEQFSEQHESINSALIEVDPDNRRVLSRNKYFTEDIYSATLECYLESEEQMNIWLESTRPIVRRSPSTTPEGRQLVGNQTPKLPRLDLPKFNGSLSDWISFKDIFTALVVANDSIAPVAKLQYLKLCLTGLAENHLKNTSITAENFQGAWDSLVKFYENKRLLVDSSLHTILTAKPITKESAQELEKLYGTIMQSYRALQSLQRPVEYWDDFLVHVVSGKLDSETIKAWEQHLGSCKDPPTWTTFNDFLMTRLITLKAYEKLKRVLTQKNNNNNSTIPSRCHYSGEEENKKGKPSSSCLICQEDHPVYKCPKFLSKNLQQRRELVFKSRLCYNCLGEHRVNNCQSTKRCTKCGKKHHSSLHETSRNQINRKDNTENKKDDKKTTKDDSINWEYVVARALLDQGSQISLITEELAHHLRLDRHAKTIPLIGIGGHKSHHTRGIVTLDVKPWFKSNEGCTIQAYILPKLTSTLPAIQVNPSWKHLSQLQLADPNYHVPGQVDLLLGSAVYAQIIRGDMIRGPHNTPIAQLTTFGWVVSGPTNQESHENHQAHHCALDHDLYNLLERLWTQEEMTPRSLTMTPEEEECEKHFVTTHTRDQTGRYVVRLPLKQSITQLGDSFTAAQRMLSRQLSKFKANPSYKQLYSDFLNEYEQLGHMRKVDPAQLEPTKVFYLPHHGVLRESSLTTKLRVVFNGSKPTSSGISLNNILHTGKKLQTDLLDVLIWFRQFKYVFTADIEKMYRQIKVHQDDWKLQRILWINEAGQMNKYELTTVTYGLASAPFLAMRVILQLIKDEGAKYPLASTILEHGRYVDDVFGGADSLSQAHEIIKQVDELCMAGGFKLQKWVGNHPAIVDNIPDERRGSKTARKIEEQAIVHTLGLSWNPRSDTFHFFKHDQHPATKITKRSILSQIAQLFDPLGLVSPVIIRAKILIQELWLIKLDWDDPVPTNIETKWNEFQQQLSDLSLLSVPRWLGVTTGSSVELHGFSDASTEAMAAVVYLRVTNDSTTVRSTTLIASKTKVAPLKRLTVPRLELSAAALLAKLVHHIIKVLNLQHAPIHLWTDSSIVYTWLNAHPSRWKEYVHNRVCFIQEQLPTATWHFVPGQMNPADCATRGLSPQQLSQHSLWWSGPEWLKEEPSRWSIHPLPAYQTENLEERPTQVHVASVKPVEWELLRRYLSLTKLLRITAICKRVIQCFKRKSSDESSQLKPEELEWARTFWVQKIQRSSFPKEIDLLTSNQSLPKDSPLVKLNPFIDSHDLLRVGGRLQQSPLDYPIKYPLILPRHNYFSTLVIADSHQRTLHGGTQLTLMDIRNSYWIVGGRAPVRSYILKCVICSKFRQQRAKQLMGQLPSTCTTPSRPFLHAGVDYAGPLLIKTWKGKNARTYKAYIAVFVCYSTSAVHLELVTDYTANGFIAAYKRFTSRRGICATLTSDCGTTLVGADTELRKLLEQGSQESEKLASLLANDGTKWHFNPPGAPHFGGKMEANVKCVKNHLKRVIKDTLLTYEEMTTFLYQVEAVLN